jgi:hypothetical protein
LLAITEDSVSLASAFAIGFTIGVITTLRLLGLTFNATQRVFRKVIRESEKHPIDSDMSDEVDRDTEGNPP